MVAFPRVEHEVAESPLLESHDPSTGFIVIRAVGRLDLAGKNLLDPRQLDGGGEAEVGDGLARLDLGDLAGDEGIRFANAGLVVEAAAAVTDEAAGEVALA